MEYSTLLLSIVLGALGIYYLFKNYNFFKRHGVIQYEPSIPILGSMAPVVFRRISFIEFMNKVYNSIPDAKYFGFFATTNPVFLLRDPEIIKSVLVKNFDTFPDRRGFDELNEPLLAKNLFSLRGQKWRDVRTLLSPSFTSSKMKMMFTLMSECATDFAKFLASAREKSDMDMKDAFTKYTNDVIATCAFGIKIDSMKNPTNKFYVSGKETTNFLATRTFRFFFLRTFPSLGRILNIKLIDNHVSGFFKDIIKTTIATRDAENITRPDMLQLMMDIRSKEGRRELDIDDMIAQAFIFFFGGFDTSSTAMSFAALQLAAHLDVQMKLRQEIDKVLEESNGEVTYEALNKLEYLDLVINEVLRLYPPVIFLERLCDKDYELPPALPGEKPCIMKKGMNFWIPVFAIHHDPKYYDDPEKFCPERFVDNKMYHNSACYMPFGLGPRMCIANRFAMLELKVLLFHLLARCELRPCAKTILPIVKFEKGILIVPEGGFCIYYLFKNYNFFKRHGVIQYESSIPILGSMTPFVFRRISFIEFMNKVYNSIPDAKYFGFFATTNPVFLLRDPEIIKSVLVKNFDTFPDRRGFEGLNEPLLAKNLFSLHGQKWRDVRTLLSPSFTSSKMKMMFTLMSECAIDFAKFLASAREKSDMDMKDAFTKYTNDVIATCAFGIKIDSMKDPTNKFYVSGKEATSFFGTRSFKFLFLRTFPSLGRILNIKLIDNHVSGFFKDIIKTTIATRDTENITRPDMLQLMMDIRSKEGRRELDIDDMIAQAFIFFFGGFDTSSTAMSFAALQLAAHLDVQMKLRQEIDKVLEESNGEVTYEALNKLEYLDLVINEVLRLYPPVIFLDRLCDKDYELPPALPGEKPFTMKKGMNFWIPVFAIHHDPKYYDDPEKFCPERFLDNKMYHNSACYMPFGLGPRMCIANRFAMLELKVLLFHLLARCELRPCAKTVLPIVKFQKGIIMVPEGGFWLSVQPRSDIHPSLKSRMDNGAKP
ncbi:uncharacterized protein LOC114942302 [Nylanderia fulva]|uniref:uncharacterized protein LOC114942302 n=1 Tax=Nylanderia fulva TaxID=613905 RepID=UPI0010FB80FD|nr:uncharacterized protein LOC114942302 [Nylanderia fulva]